MKKIIILSPWILLLAESVIAQDVSSLHEFFLANYRESANEIRITGYILLGVTISSICAAAIVAVLQAFNRRSVRIISGVLTALVSITLTVKETISESDWRDFRNSAKRIERELFQYERRVRADGIDIFTGDTLLKLQDQFGIQMDNAISGLNEDTAPKREDNSLNKTNLDLPLRFVSFFNSVAYAGGPPRWVANPPRSETELFSVGFGKAADFDSAKELAIENGITNLRKETRKFIAYLEECGICIKIKSSNESYNFRKKKFLQSLGETSEKKGEMGRIRILDKYPERSRSGDLEASYYVLVSLWRNSVVNSLARIFFLSGQSMKFDLDLLHLELKKRGEQYETNK